VAEEPVRPTHAIPRFNTKVGRASAARGLVDSQLAVCQSHKKSVQCSLVIQQPCDYLTNSTQLTPIHRPTHLPQKKSGQTDENFNTDNQY
jgi:hypothetical protein